MASEAGLRNGHGVLATPAGVVHDLLDKHQSTGDSFWRVVAVLGILFIVGVIGFIMRVSDGISDRAVWGYYAAMFSVLLTTASAAPMVSIVPRLAKANWRRPISRAAEIWSLVGLFGLLWFIPLLWVLPSLEDGRRSLWFFDPGKVPANSPHIWATVALASLVLTGVALLWTSTRPDMAAIRDHSTGWRQRWAGRLALDWQGTSRQWHSHYHRVGAFSGIYFMMLVFVHFLISVDFAMALVPGWIDALYPATHAVNALQGGVATVLLTMFFMRQFGGYRDYIGHDQFWGLGKLLLALSLMWFYFWFSSFIVLWYGKKPNEQAAIDLVMTGPYLGAFFTAFIMCFIVPLLLLIWNPVRRSIWGPTLIATSVIIGIFFDRIRVYVAAYSVPGIGDPLVDKHELHAIPKTNLPDIADIFIIIGAISGALLVYMLATRIIPAVSIWEQRESLLYKVQKPFHRAEVTVLAKRD